MKFYAKIQDGQIKDLEYIKQLAKWNDKDVVVEVKLDRPTRSNQQSRYYWGVVISLISEVTGYTPDEVHELMKAKFLSKPLNIGSETFNISTTTNQSTIEFEAYMSDIRQFASVELGCFVPLPNECGYRYDDL